MTRYAGSIAAAVADVAEDLEEEEEVAAAVGDDADLRVLLRHLRLLTFRSESTRRRELDRAGGDRCSHSQTAAAGV